MADREAKKARKERVEWQNTTSGAISAIRTVIDRQDARGNREENRVILDWLTTIEYAPQQGDFRTRRQPETGQWLLDSPQFRTWLEAENQTLFCPGIPGAGKTIAVSIVVDDLTRRFGEDKNVGIAYIYCSFRRKNEQKAEHMLMSLLKQLADGQRYLPQSVVSLYESHEKKSRPSIDEISKALQAVVALHSRVFIIMDALDECQTSGGCRTKFLKEIFAIQATGGANIFATSRFLPEVTEMFVGSISLEIRASADDVRRYLSGHISQLPSFVQRSPDLQEEIKTEIIKAVDGMYVHNPLPPLNTPLTRGARFLLAQLHLDSLIGKVSPKAIRTALAKLPTGSEAYDCAYTDAMARIEAQVDEHKQLAKQVLSWITCAKRPLSTCELQHALAVRVGDPELDKDDLPQVEDMVSVCAGLVIVDDESGGIIRLVHHTTQEYFERRKDHWFPNSEDRITAICVTYLSFSVFGSGCCRTDEELEKRLRSNPFYAYASLYWGYHARKCSTARSEILHFLMCDVKRDASIQELLAADRREWGQHYSQAAIQNMTGLHLAAFFGIEDIVRCLIWYGHDLHLEDRSGRTPLSWAAQNGHEFTVIGLLHWGAHIDTRCIWDRTPLSYAAEGGHEAVVTRLIANGADIESKDDTSLTPLNYAAEGGHEAVVAQLLMSGADAESKDEEGSTPLIYSAMCGHKAVTTQLVSKNANIESKNSRGRTPLSYAAEGGHDSIVIQLIAEGADVHTASQSGRTPLSYAAPMGHKTIVQLLLAEGGDVNVKSTSGRTPLSYAAAMGFETVVAMLLSDGAEIDSRDDVEGSTPLHDASARGREGVVKQLLAKGAKIESKDMWDLTPIHYAAENGHTGVVIQLLENGAEIDVRSTDGVTVLAGAAANGHEAIAKLLIATGRVDLDATDEYGWTPLSYAAANGHQAMVRLLLATDQVDFNAKDNSPWTPITYRKSDYGCTPLSKAAANGHEGIVKLLLDKGADFETKDSSGRTPLSRAATKGHERIVKLLQLKAV